MVSFFTEDKIHHTPKEFLLSSGKWDPEQHVYMISATFSFYKSTIW